MLRWRMGQGNTNDGMDSNKDDDNDDNKDGSDRQRGLMLVHLKMYVDAQC